MTCSSSPTWAYMARKISISPGNTSGEGDTQNNGRLHFGCPQGAWFPVGPGEGLHNDQRPRFVQTRIVNESGA